MKTFIKTMWGDITSNTEVIIVLTLVWLILFEQFSLLVLVSGIILSVLVVLFTDRFLLKGNYEHSYVIGLGTLIRYFFRLLWEIVLAGIHVIPSIVTGKAYVEIISVETKLTDELLIDLIANAITLTPGSVTVDKKGSLLKVLVLNPDIPEEGDARTILPLTLEKILLDYENKTEGKA